MFVSVVIPYYNREKEIKNLLISLERQTNKSFEVIIINDGSADIRYQIEAQCFNLKIEYIYTVRTEFSGRSRARNIGIEKSKGELIVFLDADQIVKEDFIEKYINAFEKSGDDEILQFSTRKKLNCEIDLMETGIDEVDCVEDTRKSLFSEYRDLNAIQGIWYLVYSHNIAIKKRELIRYGGFDESFKGWGLEDVELAYRMKSKGVKIYYNQETESYNQYRTSIENDYEKYTQWKRNLKRFYEIHPEPEIALQEIFSLYFDEKVREKIHKKGIENVWIMCFDIFEYSLRKLVK